MLANLNKNKELVKQAQQKHNQEQMEIMIREVAQEIPKQIEKKIEMLQETIKVQYPSIFTINYEPGEQEKASIEAKQFMGSIQKLSTYANPYFIKYFGIQLIGRQKQEVHSLIEPAKEQQNAKQPLQKQADTSKKQKKQPKTAQEKRTGIKILSQMNLTKFTLTKYKGQAKSKSQFSQRISLCLQILQAVSSLNSLQFTIFPSNLEDIIFLQDQNLKLATHSTRIWRLVSQDHLNQLKTKQMGKIKKAALANISMKYKSPEFMLKPISIKDVRRNDVWKTGILIVTILSGEDMNKEVLALQAVDQTKIKEYKLVDEARISKLKKYCRIEDINQIIKLINILPSERPQLSTLIPLFRKLKSQTTEYIDSQSLQQAQRHYLKQKQSETFKYMPQLKPTQQLLTLDHKKKISQYFKSNQSRIVKDYKLLYRASNTQFSCKSFYHVAFDKKNLLIIFLQKTGKKIIAYSEQSFDLSKCNGIFGGFLKDIKKQSFIYSQNQFCKLKIPQKAIGVSHIQGPIIGDGDIVISDGGLYNFTRFPSSYQSLKLKRLLKTQKFELSEYDVYQVTF